jgi:glutamine phosphoribosylpyrophosphate amidotransferase
MDLYTSRKEIMDGMGDGEQTVVSHTCTLADDDEDVFDDVAPGEAIYVEDEESAMGDQA